MRDRLWRIVGALLLTSLQPTPIAGQARPSALDVARRFCQADGLGLRLDPQRWVAVAQLVSWPLEPAWDHIVVISGYEIQTPRLFVSRAEIPIVYTVTGTIAAGESDESDVTQQIERTVLPVEGDGSGGWRIAGAPPVPHVFASQVDAAEVRASLQPDSTTYLSDSAFVWRALSQAGWSIPYRPIRALRDETLFGIVTEPAANDVVVFLADDTPYHAGIVTAENLIASATINRGVVQAVPDVFPGSALYLRVLQPPVATTTAAVASEIETPEPETPPPTPAVTAVPTALKKTKANNRAARKQLRTKRSKPTATRHRASVPRATPTNRTR